MKSGQKISLNSKGTINHSKPQSNQKFNKYQQQLKQIQELPVHLGSNEITQKDHMESIKCAFEPIYQTLPQRSNQRKSSFLQTKSQNASNQCRTLLVEQNERIGFLQNINFSTIFGSKKLYKPLTQLTQKFTSTIQKGIISVNQMQTDLNRSDTNVICFKKSKTQESKNLLGQSNKIKQIQKKKQQILQELKQLYQAEQQLRAQQKLFWSKKKSHYQLIQTSKDTATKIHFLQGKKSEFLQRSKPELSKKLFNIREKAHSSISQFRGQSSIIQNKSQRKSLPKSTFDHEQKRAIKQIIKKENENQSRQKQKISRMFDQLEQQQKQLLEEEKMSLDAERKKRRKLALERLKKQQNTKTQFIIRTTKIHTEPHEVENNEFFSSNLNSTSKVSRNSQSTISPKKSYSYIHYHQLDQEKKNQQVEYSRLILQKRKQQNKLDFHSIKVHLNKYKQAKNQQNQLVKDKIQHFKLQQNTKIKQIRQKYGFLTQIKETLLEEEKNSIEKYEKQLDRKANYHKKMKNYFYSIQKKPKLKLKPNLIESRTLKATSEENFRLKSSKELYENEEYCSQNKVDKILRKDEGNKQADKNLDNFCKMEKQKMFINEKISLSKIQQGALTKRRLQHNKNIQKKEEQMIRILRRDTSSLKEIKKALQIFHQLHDPNQSTSRHGKRKSKKRLVAW